MKSYFHVKIKGENKMGEDLNYEQEFDSYWKDIVLNEDGTVNLDQVKRELSDYSMVMEIASEVYGNITNGNISKPNTNADVIIDVANEEQDKFYYNIHRDDILSILDEEDMSSEDKLEEIRNYFDEERE